MEDDMDDFLVNFPHIKNELQSQIFNNPYDSERDFFYQTCFNNIQYLKTLPKDILQAIYYSSDILQYDFGQMVFSIGQECENIYIILQGVVSIELSNGINSFQIDVIGRGSVIGVNNLISSEEWVYQAKAASSQTVLILTVSRRTLFEKAAEYNLLNKTLEQFKET